MPLIELRTLSIAEEEDTAISKISSDSLLINKKSYSIYNNNIPDYIPKRYILIIFVFICSIINYTDRTNISYAIISMAADFNWNDTQKGLALSAFYIGYFLSNIPAGYLAHKYGGAIVLSIASAFWSFFSIITPIAAYNSYVTLIFIRILLGFAEGFAFPCLHHLTSAWLPLSEQSFAVTFFTAGCSFGVVLTALVSPSIIENSSWKSVFYLFGAIGLVWTAFWFWWSTNTPEEMKGIDANEIKLINSDKVAEEIIEYIPWVALLTNKQLWAFYLNMFASGWSFFVLLAWMPDYFSQFYNIDLSSVGYYSLMPYIVQGLFGPLCGYIADYFKYKYTPMQLCTTMQMIGLIGPIIFLFLLGFTVATPAIASFYLTMALGLNAATNAGACVYHLIVIPKYAGIVFSIGNALSIIPAIVGIIVSGSLVDAYHSWTLVFVLGIACYVIGIVSWLFLADDKLIIIDDISDRLSTYNAVNDTGIGSINYGDL